MSKLTSYFHMWLDAKLGVQGHDTTCCEFAKELLKINAHIQMCMYIWQRKTCFICQLFSEIDYVAVSCLKVLISK